MAGVSDCASVFVFCFILVWRSFNIQSESGAICIEERRENAQIDHNYFEEFVDLVVLWDDKTVLTASLVLSSTLDSFAILIFIVFALGSITTATLFYKNALLFEFLLLKAFRVISKLFRQKWRLDTKEQIVFRESRPILGGFPLGVLNGLDIFWINT